MAPGFTSAGFEGATVDTLLARFPDRAVEIRRLAPTDGVTTMPTDLAT
jgi:hypothetical protein